MVPVLNRPHLEHMIYYLKGHQIDDITLALCHLSESIVSYFGDGSKFGVKLTYVVERSPLGSAGGVKNAEGHLDDSPFFIFNGDIFTDIDLTEMLAFHRRMKAKVSLALTAVENPTIYGVVETDAQGRVKHFIEKPPWEKVTTNSINAGIYILTPEILREVPPNTPFTFEHHLFPQLLDKGVPIYGYRSCAYWIDIGTPEKYLQLHHDLLSGKSISYPGKDKEFVAQCFIHPTAQMKGAIIIGNSSIIGPNVHIKGPAVLGPGCNIGEGSQILGAILWHNVQVGSRASLKNCIVGNDSLIGDDSLIPEGSVLGDNVVVGNRSNLEPGSRIWPGVSSNTR
jgi:mannose-1-phosphate guanylyltransferase